MVHQILGRVVPEFPLLVVVHQILGFVVTRIASEANGGGVVVVVVWSEVAHPKHCIVSTHRFSANQLFVVASVSGAQVVKDVG